jgi:hypothetical protein
VRPLAGGRLAAHGGGPDARAALRGEPRVLPPAAPAQEEQTPAAREPYPSPAAPAQEEQFPPAPTAAPCG